MFAEYEVTVLRSYAEGLLALLEHRARSYSPVAVLEQQDALLPVAVTTDPRLLAILRDQVGEEPGCVLALVENECFGSVGDSLRSFLTTLPLAGGRVELASRVDAQEWVRAVRIYITSIITVTDHEGNSCGQMAKPTLDWLEDVVKCLVAVLDDLPAR
ncbi:hypothetical protein V1227_06375 [Lentzea sp. DG1S-22]|nr:hypothetical protein [Lentzea sp. DG1S-22]WVH82378.1 hypothetical protein V1227_06375 [Lentzea sp. DG1S-22]